MNVGAYLLILKADFGQSPLEEAQGQVGTTVEAYKAKRDLSEGIMREGSGAPPLRALEKVISVN